MNAPGQLRLTPTLHQQVMAAIRAGGFPHIAAQAFGVTPALLEDWLRRGEHGRKPGGRRRGKRGARRFRAFATEVREAFAQARLKAEIHVFNEDPPRWLEHGPGRDSADNAGWSSAVKALINLAAERSALDDPMFLDFVGSMMNELADLPDVRKRLVALSNWPDQAKADQAKAA